jgi:hypothetical protein
VAGGIGPQGSKDTQVAGGIGPIRQSGHTGGRRYRRYKTVRTHRWQAV